jgi:hypothetical protein
MQEDRIVERRDLTRAGNDSSLQSKELSSEGD